MFRCSQWVWKAPLYGSREAAFAVVVQSHTTALHTISVAKNPDGWRSFFEYISHIFGLRPKLEILAETLLFDNQSTKSKTSPHFS
jgi:hypothetical protein